jgi:hypothetical protein
MTKQLSREDAHSEKLLDLAEHWRKYAAEATDANCKAMMLRTAEELERAAAKATRQEPATHRAGAGELLWLDSSE